MVAVQHLNPYGELQLPAPLAVVNDEVFRADGVSHQLPIFRSRMKRHMDFCAERSRLDSLAAGVLRHDAVDTLLASRDVEQVIVGATRDVTGPRYGLEYIPIETGGVQPWADRFIQKRVTRAGLLDYVLSSDMPWISVAMQEHVRSLRTLGARFGWSWFELQRAQFAGEPLRPELVYAFTQAAEETKDMIFLQGDSGLPKGLGLIPTGLINDPNVTSLALSTGNWPGASNANIMTAFAGAIAAFNTLSRRRRMIDTWLMSEEYYSHLVSTQVANTNMNLLSFLLANNAMNLPGAGPAPVRVGVIPNLSTASGSGGQRQVFFSRNPQTIRGVLPLDVSFIADESFALRTDVYGVLRIVGVEIREPFAVLYADG